VSSFTHSPKTLAHSPKTLAHSPKTLAYSPKTLALLAVLVPVVSEVRLVTPVQGNYAYSVWQLGTLQLLVRSSFHGFTRSTTSEEELISCYAKLEYQPQFGFEQITDGEYRRLWLQSYLRQGTSLLLGKVDLHVSLSLCVCLIVDLQDASMSSLNN
jgi:hypothetical protein